MGLGHITDSPAPWLCIPPHGMAARQYQRCSFQCEQYVHGLPACDGEPYVLQALTQLAFVSRRGGRDVLATRSWTQACGSSGAQAGYTTGGCPPLQLSPLMLLALWLEHAGQS